MAKETGILQGWQHQKNRLLINKKGWYPIMKRFALFTLSITAFLMVANCGGKDYREVIHAPEQKFYLGQHLDAARMLLPEINSLAKISFFS